MSAPTKREVARRCAPIFAQIQRRLDEEARAARVNRPAPRRRAES